MSFELNDLYRLVTILATLTCTGALLVGWYYGRRWRGFLVGPFSLCLNTLSFYLAYYASNRWTALPEGVLKADVAFWPPIVWLHSALLLAGYAVIFAHWVRTHHA